MSEMVYRPEMRTAIFHPAARLPATIDPNEANRLVASLRLPDGDMLASDIIAAGQDPASPIYDAFTHDPEKAIEKVNRGEAMYLIGMLYDAETGERLYLSRYDETKDSNDIGRIRVNVRLLPHDQAPALPVKMTVRTVSAPAPEPVPERPPMVVRPVVAAPVLPPERERAIVTLRKWAEAYGSDPYFAGVVAAIRTLG